MNATTTADESALAACPGSADSAVKSMSPKDAFVAIALIGVGGWVLVCIIKALLAALSNLLSVVLAILLLYMLVRQ